MKRVGLLLLMAGSLLALPQPVKHMGDQGATPANWSAVHPGERLLQTSTLMPAIVRFRRDYQQNYVTTIRLWADPAWNGIYATDFSGVGFVWNFYDFGTESWAAADTGFLPWHNGGYGGMFVAHAQGQYPEGPDQYYPLWTAHDYETNDYHPSVWFPNTGSVTFNPFSWTGEYFGDTSAGVGVDYIWPRVGVTENGHVHLMVGSANDGFVYYNRNDGGSWLGFVPVLTSDIHPWLAFYADPNGQTLVATYYDSQDGHIKMIADTQEGMMFYGGNFLTKDLSNELSQYDTLFYGFVGDGHPFVDKDGNIHHILFGSNGNTIVPLSVWHFFWDLTADTTHWSLITFIDGDVYYPVGINTLVAGRAQMAQNPENGDLYVIWEQFIQEPGRFVLSTTGDTFAPTKVVLARSRDNGVTWDTLITLAESDADFNNHWLRFPVLSPRVMSVTEGGHTYDRVVWGVYEDYDPGFAWQGQGVDSTVVMWVGITDIPVGVAEEGGVATPALRVTTRPGGAIFQYSLPAAARVSLEVYRADGRKVATLVQGEQSAGEHQVRWTAKDASGVYLYRLTVDGKETTGKVLLVR